MTSSEEESGLSRLLRPTVASRNSQLRASRETSKERTTVAFSSQKSALADSMRLTSRLLRSNTTMTGNPTNTRTALPMHTLEITVKEQDEISDLTEDEVPQDSHAKHIGLSLSRTTINHRKLLDELRIKVQSTEQLLQTPSNVKALNIVGRKHTQLMKELKSKYVNLGFFQN